MAVPFLAASILVVHAAPISNVPLQNVLNTCGGHLPGEAKAQPGSQPSTRRTLRFWKALGHLRVKSLKAREAPEVDSQLIFEFPKGSVVGQSQRSCVLVAGLWRLPIYQPRNLTSLVHESREGWVTLSAEMTGGPRFFSQVADGEVEALSAANARRCGVEPFPEDGLVFFQQESELVANRACEKDVHSLCKAPEGFLNLNENMLEALETKESLKKDRRRTFNINSWNQHSRPWRLC
eukprot:g29744.t1